MTLIKADGISKKFGQNPVLENVSFEVEKGDFLFIVGENGTGKTTLMRIILGLLKPDSGNIEYIGIKKNEIGYLPQYAKIQADFPACVGEVVMSGFLNRRRFFYGKEQKNTAKEILSSLGLKKDIWKKPFSDLSGGQKQRVLLARAVCAEGGILLLDEPQANLDPIATAELYELIEKLKEDGKTLIMISHDVECAVKYGNKILHLGHDGMFFGSSEEYLTSPEGNHMLGEGHHHHD